MLFFGYKKHVNEVIVQSRIALGNSAFSREWRYLLVIALSLGYRAISWKSRYLLGIVLFIALFPRDELIREISIFSNIGVFYNN